NPACGQVWDGGIDICPACSSRALFLEVCRTCGQDFWRGWLEEPQPPAEHTLHDAQIGPGLPYESTPHAIHFASQLHPLAADEDGEDDPEEDDAGPEEPEGRTCWV